MRTVSSSKTKRLTIGLVRAGDLPLFLDSQGDIASARMRDGRREEPKSRAVIDNAARPRSVDLSYHDRHRRRVMPKR